MKTSELIFDYPEKLIATEPRRPSRVLLSRAGELSETTPVETIGLLQPGDVLLINDTSVEKRRVSEILFVEKLTETTWEVLCPARRFGKSEIALPEGIKAKVIKRGRPQVVELSQPLPDGYFDRAGEVPLPPYIRRARNDSHEKAEDEEWYQPDWAEHKGSSASPTASLHFTNEDLDNLRSRGVHVCPVTLHVGLGTYLPIESEDLDKHEIHKEWIRVPESTWAQVQKAKESGHKVWALGTTVARAIESAAQGTLEGETDLFILPGHEFKVVDVLMTNFHQPSTTLLALVCAFAGQQRVLKAYEYAVDNEFRLFSYGDLSVWLK